MYSIEQINLDWKEKPDHNIELLEVGKYTDLPNDWVVEEAAKLAIGKSVNLSGYLITRTA